MRPANIRALAFAATARGVFLRRCFDVQASSAPLITNLVEDTKPIPTQTRRTVISMIFALSAAVGAVGTAKADQPPDHHGQITIENIWITPAGRGDRSILRLRVINEGHDHVHLLGLETPVATDVRIVGRISDYETTTFNSVIVRADSDLDLTTDHMWIELGPLTRAVRAGESIPLELVFVRSRVRAEAHVHGADG